MNARLAVTTLVLLSPLALRAQSPTERAALAAWNDTVQHVTTPVALGTLDGPSRRGSGRAGEVRRALYQVRHADLVDSRGEIELVLTNMQIAANRTKSPWPHYVMALAFEAMARKEWIETVSDGKKPAERHTDATWRTLREALDVDPSFVPARRMLGDLAAAGGDRFLRRDQVRALDREAKQPDADPDALLAWGRHLRTLREYPLALATFDRAIVRGGDAGRLQLERARTLQALGSAARASDAYWAGLASPTGATREMYRFDLAWITDSAALADFDAVPDSSIAPWLRRFWNSRDADAANHAGDRLNQHLRRWVKAMEDYRALSPWKDAFFSRVEMGFDYAAMDAAPLTENQPVAKKSSCTKMDAAMFDQLWQMQPAHRGDLRLHEPLLDHRGLVFLRHGEPQRRIDGGGATGGGLLGGTITRLPHHSSVDAGQARGPNGAELPWSASELGAAPDQPNGPAGESWVYGLEGSWHVLQFRGSQALGSYAATTMTQMVPRDWLYSPNIESSIPGMNYVGLATRVDKNESGPMRKALLRAFDNPTCFIETMAVAAQTRADEHEFISRDTDTPADLKPSNSVMQAFALGVANDFTGEALVSFALASEVLKADVDSAGQNGYTVSFRMVAYDKFRDRTIEVDTVRRFNTTRPISRGQFLTASFEFALPAGNWNIATRAYQVGGAVIINDSRRIHVDALAAVTLSDIVTGRPGNPGWDATDGSPFPVNYPNGWFPGEAAELFYEVRGIPGGADYRTSLEVRPVNPKATGLSQIVSTDRAGAGVTYVRKTLGLTQLLPGKYRVVVTVEFAGLKVSREREILIVPRP